jgi:galactokinase
VPREHVKAFAPGRVNLIGEHTDYNGGLALPFAIAQGITVEGRRNDERRILAGASDLGEQDAFALEDRTRGEGWRAFVRGTVAELSDAGFPPPGAQLQIGGDLPRGAGLSSSAALEVALCLALLALGEGNGEDGSGAGGAGGASLARLDIARLCARVENDWVGAQTGLLDQIASLYGEPDTALCIDFATLGIEPVPLRLEGWRLVVLDSGESHSNSAGGYNERRTECARACELLGIEWLSEADDRAVEALPGKLRLRAQHVLGENDRVRAAVAALRSGELQRLGPLLDASHESLRDLYEISTPAVEATVGRLLDAGASGARILGGGFGGCVLAMFAPGTEPPAQALEVHPAAGAHLLHS